MPLQDLDQPTLKNVPVQAPLAAPLASIPDSTPRKTVCMLWPRVYSAQRTCVAWAEALEPFAKVSIFDPDGTCPVSLAVREKVEASLCFTFEYAETDSDKLIWICGAEDDLLLEQSFTNVTHKLNTAFREIWLTPQSVPRAAMMARMFRATLRVMPQLWSRLPINPDHLAFANIPERDATSGYDIVITGCFTSSEQSIVFPLLITEAANKAKADLVESVIIVVPEKFDSTNLEANAKQLDVGPKVRIVNALEQDIVPFFLQRKRATIFLHHQHDRTEHPELLWHAAWCGFPVIHNLKTSLQVGLRYVDNDIGQAARMLLVSKDSFGDAYVQRNRAALKALDPSEAKGKIVEFFK